MATVVKLLSILQNPSEVEPVELHSENIYEDKIIFPDFKTGPLTKYRQLSTFCYKRMNVLLEGEEHIRLKVSMQAIKISHNSNYITINS